MITISAGWKDAICRVSSDRPAGTCHQDAPPLEDFEQQRAFHCLLRPIQNVIRIHGSHVLPFAQVWGTKILQPVQP
jgi:hypothetical protein